MGRRFRSYFSVPAWVGVDQEEELLVNQWFAQSKHDGKRFMQEMFGQAWGDEPRSRRGDIKFLLLELLSEQPNHGYDLIKQIENRHGGVRRPSPGSVYPTLQLLEDGGYVTSEQREGKKIYTITDEGRKLLNERIPPEPATDFAQSPFSNFPAKFQEFHALRKAATDLAAAIIQVSSFADPEQMKRVRELIEETKRDIYAILAEK